MQSIAKSLSTLTIGMVLFSVAFSDTAKPAIDDLRWMSGCWEGTDGKRNIQEHWMRPAGQTLFGMSRTIIQEKTVAFEYMRIHQDESGILLTAQPSRQKEASFRLTQATSDSVAFENPQHDFPQRIIYRKDSSGGLFARIEGKTNGQERGIDFLMKRAKCE
jgi:hypothetical protein